MTYQLKSELLAQKRGRTITESKAWKSGVKFQWVVKNESSLKFFEPIFLAFIPCESYQISSINISKFRSDNDVEMIEKAALYITWMNYCRI